MKIYIAYNFANVPLAVVLAKSKEFAQVAFTAMTVPWHHTETIDPNDTSHPDVVHLFSSKGTADIRIRKWRRGL